MFRLSGPAKGICTAFFRWTAACQSEYTRSIVVVVVLRLVYSFLKYNTFRRFLLRGVHHKFLHETNLWLQVYPNLVYRWSTLHNSLWIAVLSDSDVPEVRTFLTYKRKLLIIVTDWICIRTVHVPPAVNRGIPPAVNWVLAFCCPTAWYNPPARVHPHPDLARVVVPVPGYPPAGYLPPPAGYPPVRVPCSWHHKFLPRDWTWRVQPPGYCPMAFWEWHCCKQHYGIAVPPCGRQMMWMDGDRCVSKRKLPNNPVMLRIGLDNTDCKTQILYFTCLVC